MRPGAREAFQRTVPVRHVVRVAPEDLSNSLPAADSVPEAALRPSLPVSFTTTAIAESPPSSTNVCLPENRCLPLRDSTRSSGPAENPGERFLPVTALEIGSVMPSPQVASHAMTADLSLAAFLSAVTTIASPERVLPPNTAFAASAPGAAPSVAATVAAAPARMVVVRMACLRVDGLGMWPTLGAIRRPHIGHPLDLAPARRPIFRARAP